MSCKSKVHLPLLQEAIRKHAEVLSKGGESADITEEGVGVPTGGVDGGGGGVKRVSSELEGGGKRSLTALGRVDSMYQNVVKYGALNEHQVRFETDLVVLVSKETSLPLSIVTSPWFRTLVLMRDPRIESTFLCEGYIKRIFSNHVTWPSLSHTIFTCVSCVSIHVV